MNSVPPSERAHGRRWGPLFAVVWLFYLLNPLGEGWGARDTAAGWVAIIGTLVFAGLYVAIFVLMSQRRRSGSAFRAVTNPWTGVAIVAVQLALTVAVCLAIGQTGTAMTVYIAVTMMMCFPARIGWAGVVILAGATFAATHLVSGWEVDRGLLFGTLVAALAIWGVGRSIAGNIEVLRVREANAQLELSNQRNRFARDLHDILGHSLTVVTVKAELAQRLLDSDPERARAELVDIERLSRDALADVRRAVDGYREITLPGELAGARMALEAAGIRAELPNTTDAVPTELRELFAWTVREGVTNVVRHSGAARCQVQLAPDRAVVSDDGTLSGPLTPGNGLTGLRERAEAVGARVVTSATDGGFTLQVVTEPVPR